MAKQANGNRKTITTATRWSPLEYRRLVLRRKNSRAKTDSAYIRAAALTGAEFQMPSFDTLREVRNALIQLAEVLSSLPPGPLQQEALAEAKGALGRICK